MLQTFEIKTSSILFIAKALKNFFFLHDTNIDLYPEIVLRYQRRKLERTKKGQERELGGPERDGTL